MKISSLLLVASLAANGVLVATLMMDSQTVPLSFTAPSRLAAGSSAIISPPTVRNTTGGATATPREKATDTLWTEIYSNDFQELKQRLVAAGFPPKAIRALLNQAIIDQQNLRLESVRGKQKVASYWESPFAPKKLDSKQRAEVDKVYRDSQELRYQFVNGPDSLADDEEALAESQRRFGKLPLQKLQQLTAIEHNFERQRSELFTNQSADGKNIHPSMETMQALDQTHLADVAQLLAPTEFEQYELRATSMSYSLRARLVGFRPSEDEFKAIYAIEKQFKSSGPTDQLMTQAKAALGPDRFAEYAVTLTSDGSGNLGQLIGRLELPLTTVTTVNALRDDINTRAKALNTDTTLSAAQREAQLGALATEAQEKLVASLGERGFRAYSDLKGSWLRAPKPKHQ